jgi:hypothetical protein
MTRFLLAATVGRSLASVATAEDKKSAGALTLTLVAKTDTYKYEPQTPPKPLIVDLVVLRITNTSKERLTVYVGGDVNEYTFELTGGAGTVSLNNPGPFSTDLKLPKAVALASGERFEIPVTRLSDGLRGVGRALLWTGPGEYALNAKYTLADKDGGKDAELTSAPVKLTVTNK